MYAIYEINPGTLKTRRVERWKSTTFKTIELAIDHIGNVHTWERDPDGYDAADVFTKAGEVFSVERVK